jgi:hypothetical protein
VRSDFSSFFGGAADAATPVYSPPSLRDAIQRGKREEKKKGRREEGKKI